MVLVVVDPFLSIKELLAPLLEQVPGSCESDESSCESRRCVNCFTMALSIIFEGLFFSASSSDPSVELPSVVRDLWNFVLLCWWDALA